MGPICIDIALVLYFTGFVDSTRLHPRHNQNCTENRKNDNYVTIHCCTLSIDYQYLTQIYNDYGDDLRKIELINSTINKLNAETFYSMRATLEVNLSYNKINHLNSDMFNPMISLINLDVSHNELVFIENLRIDSLQQFNVSHNRLTDNVLENLSHMNNLEYLDLRNNLIENLNMSLLRMTNLKTLLLDYNRIITVSAVDFKGVPALAELSIVGNTIENIKDLGGKTDIILNVSYNAIGPSLDAMGAYSLDLSNNRISGISEWTIRDTIQYVDLSCNEINVTLTANLFAEATNLLHLNLSSNRVADVEAETFAASKKLRVVDLSANFLKDMAFVDGLRTPVELYMSDNHIAEFKMSNRSARLVEILDLHNNSLGSGDFSSLIGVILLDVRSNNITNISIHCGGKLENVDFSYNTIDKATFLGNCSSVQRLAGRGNRLKDFSFMRNQNMTSLELLDLSCNDIAAIDETTLKLLPAIKVLNLSGNQISILSSGLFSFQKYMEKLDLSENTIAAVPFGLFTNCLNIKTINLSHNRLTKFNFYLIYHNTLINNIILDNNQITNIDLNPFRNKNFNIDNHVTFSLGGNLFKCHELAEIIYVFTSLPHIIITSSNKSFKTENIQGITCKDTIDDLKKTTNNNTIIHNTIYRTKNEQPNSSLLANISNQIDTLIQIVNVTKYKTSKMAKYSDEDYDILKDQIDVLKDKLNNTVNHTIFKTIEAAPINDRDKDLEDIRVKMLELQVERIGRNVRRLEETENENRQKQEPDDGTNSLIIIGVVCLITITIIQISRMLHLDRSKIFNIFRNLRSSSARTSVRTLATDIELTP